jgi:hypothetical protein
MAKKPLGEPRALYGSAEYEFFDLLQRLVRRHGDLPVRAIAARAELHCTAQVLHRALVGPSLPSTRLIDEFLDALKCSNEERATVISAFELAREQQIKAARSQRRHSPNANKAHSELHKSKEPVVGRQLAQPEQNPSRHRSTVDELASQQISDASGFDLKPNPLTATTPAEFIEVLWQYRAWSGNPPWRTMAKRADQTVVHSTMYAAMNGDALPKFDVVKAIIIGCGGGEDDLSSFASAWRRIATGI